MSRALLLLLLCIQSGFAQEIPPNGTSFDQEFDVSIFYKIQKHHQFLLKTAYIPQSKQSDRKEMHLSYRYSIHRNWKIGLSLKRVYGMRHNEDWNKETGTWEWRDTSARGESFVGIFLQHKQIAWGKGRGILKNRLELLRNTFNDQDTLLYKLGIINFEFKKWITIHQFEFFIPLNYNDDPISEIWHYSSFMYQYSTFLKFGPKLSLGKMFWNESIDYSSRKGNKFSHDLLIYRLGLGALFTF